MGAEEASRDAGDQARHPLAAGVQHGRRGAEGHGLSVRRRRRPGVYHTDAHGCTKATQPNHVWTVDFKGWFTLGDGQRGDPLTVRDHYSHCILCADALPNQQYKATLQVFKGLMRHHRPPEVIHCDLGSPFASHGLGRLSALSAWWVEQGTDFE